MKIESIFKHFLVTQISHIPVVNAKFEIIGLLSKDKVSMEMADISISSREFEKIPTELLDFEISESILYYFQAHTQIPIINEQSSKVDSWDKPRFLAEFSRLQKVFPVEAPKKEKQTSEFTESKAAIFGLMSQILSNFPDALYSTDKEGTTTFYNESFETEILTLPKFKDSISLAEKYFKELSLDLIGSYLKHNEIKSVKNKTSFPTVQAFVKNLNLMVRVITLHENENVLGYLFHFIQPKTFIHKMNEKGFIFPSVEEAFSMNHPLTSLIDDIETRYIYYRLVESEDNISHAAESLKIPRSSLQHKIRVLKVYEKFAEKNKSPIPRNSKKIVEKKHIDVKKVKEASLKSSNKFTQKVTPKQKNQKSKKLSEKNPKRNIKSRGKEKPKSIKKR